MSALIQRPLLHGVFPMLVTPFDPDGTIRWGDFARQIEYVLVGGVQGVACLGLGGEVGRLTTDERFQVAKTVLTAVAGRAPVVVGCSAQDTATAVALARHATAHGADVLMVAPPAEPGIAEERLLAHYAAVAEAAGETAVMIQDAPAYVGVALSAEFVLRLAADYPNVRYAKSEAEPAFEKTAELVAGAGGRLAVFGGQAALHYLDVLDAGATGMMPGPELPDVYAGIYRAYAAGSRDEALRRFLAVLPLLVFQAQTLDCFLACAKALLHHRGVIGSPALRPPARPLSAAAHAALERYWTLTGMVGSA